MIWFLKQFGQPDGRFQTKSNSSPLGQRHCPLCDAEFAPLGMGGSTVRLEDVAPGQAAIMVEMVEDARVDGGAYRADAVPPVTYRLVTDVDAAFMVEQVFDVPQLKRKATGEHHRQADDLRARFEKLEWVAFAMRAA